MFLRQRHHRQMPRQILMIVSNTKQTFLEMTSMLTVQILIMEEGQESVTQQTNASSCANPLRDVNFLPTSLGQGNVG